MEKPQKRLEKIFFLEIFPRALSALLAFHRHNKLTRVRKYKKTTTLNRFLSSCGGSACLNIKRGIKIDFLIFLLSQSKLEDWMLSAIAVSV